MNGWHMITGDDQGRRRWEFVCDYHRPNVHFAVGRLWQGAEMFCTQCPDNYREKVDELYARLAVGE